jgi:hypothetical protein
MWPAHGAQCEVVEEAEVGGRKPKPREGGAGRALDPKSQ